ncbi:hypothetical protein [Cellulophaga baltica]|uniref:hypothetical protein n=1 Tax=Cellulophaga baltica TaxID=76594 RepID=UPI002494141E|nr:hypothetical protein [Cellulophaga baltica]
MAIDPIYSTAFILATSIFTILVVKRLGSQSGCITYGYIGLILFSINIFFIFSGSIFISTLKDTFTVLVSGENYTATVSSYSKEEVYDSDEDKYETMYTPTVSFNTKYGQTIERELDFSTTNLELGDTYKINYNKLDDKIITLGFMLFIKLAGTFIFCFIFSFLFIGELLFAFNKNMDTYYSIVKKAGFYFFLPFLMIGFDALLIYGLINGNEVPIWVSLVLVFFIVVLTLAIVGYLKTTYAKGIPVMVQVAPNRWVGDWKEEEEEEEEEEEDDNNS